jgi:UDP-GlcNAc3NAcA epimerase
MKILNVVGARPNFIKISPLLKEYQKNSDIESILVHTGQHYDYNMSESFFKDLNISKPKYNLNVGSGSHAVQTAKMMVEFEKICIKEKPDAVVVLGDINSTIAAGLVAVKIGIKLVHIEAGMRSFDMTMPEEINRVLTDHISNINLCSTKTALQNLKNENIQNGVIVGDLMYDSYLKFIEKSEEESNMLNELNLKKNEYYLMTCHRQATTDNKDEMELLIDSLNEINEKIVFPMHPRFKKMLNKFGFKNKLKNNIIVIDPIGYLDMMKLLSNSKIFLTDSGGLQKEAFFAKVPCITLRDRTEWIETIGIGNVLCPNFANIKKKINDHFKKKYSFNDKPYGMGNSSELIIKEILKLN